MLVVVPVASTILTAVGQFSIRSMETKSNLQIQGPHHTSEIITPSIADIYSGSIYGLIIHVTVGVGKVDCWKE